MRKTALGFLAVALLTAASPLRPVVGIRDIMKYEVDPSADSLWDSVSSSNSAAGPVEKQPHSEEDWQEVRRSAVTLVEAANLLLIDGRRVAADGRIEDVDVPGILPPAEIDRKIARELQDAARQALEAVDSRNAARLFDAGGKLDEACEACHVRFWYPGDRHPPLPVHVNLEPKP
jgi:hypothetical protein